VSVVAAERLLLSLGPADVAQALLAQLSGSLLLG
jgi:hypothetical protein